MEKGLRTGLWRQDGGAEIELVVEGESLSGYYRTVHGRADEGVAFPLVGLRNGDLCGFTVGWGVADSLTSWCGRYVREADGREALRTMWLMGRLYEDKEKTRATQPWETFHTNSGTFYFCTA